MATDNYAKVVETLVKGKQYTYTWHLVSDRSSDEFTDSGKFVSAGNGKLTFEGHSPVAFDSITVIDGVYGPGEPIDPY